MSSLPGSGRHLWCGLVLIVMLFLLAPARSETIRAESVVLSSPAIPSPVSHPAKSSARIVLLRFVELKNMVALLQFAFPDLRFFANDELNAIEFFDTPERTRDAEALIAQNDIPERPKRDGMVLVELQILEISHLKSTNIGVELTNWAVSLQSILPPEAITKDNFSKLIPGFVNTRGEKASVRILATPKILVMNKQKAQIIIGDKIPIPITTSSITSGGQVVSSTAIQFEEVGIKLQVTPTLHPEQEVSLDIAAEVSSRGKTTQQGFPEIGTRNALTMIRLKDRYSAVLGGLMKEESRSTRVGLPLLMHIPFIGGLFGSTKQETIVTEIRIAITPRIITPDMFEVAPSTGPAQR